MKHRPFAPYAIIADRMQEEICDNGSCDIRRLSLHTGMDAAEIRQRAETLGISIRELAARVPMDENKLTKSLGKQARRLTVEEMDGLRRVLRVDEEAESVSSIRTIPLLGEVPAGGWRPAHQAGGRRLAISDPDTPAHAYALTVVGDSMDLIVPDGSTLVIDPDDKKLWPGRRYVVQTDDGQTTFKEYQDEPARLVPCSSNPEHQEILLGAEPIIILGRVFSYSMRDIPRRK